MKYMGVPAWIFLALVCPWAAWAQENGARFLSQSVPSAVRAGQSFPVSVTFENSGTTAWSREAGYKLGSQNPQDALTWGLGRVFLAGGELISPGRSKTFAFSAVAPSTPGVYGFQWRMVQEGVGWFGDMTPSVQVEVRPAPRPAEHTVSTIFFSKFYPEIARYSALSGRTPSGGWENYDCRDPHWARRQIKDMMVANIDIVFHEWDPRSGDPRLTVYRPPGFGVEALKGLKNFLASYRHLLEKNYEPPLLAQWVNLELFHADVYSRAYGRKLDVSTPQGRDYFYQAAVAPFWRELFAALGSTADAHLAKRGRKVLVSLDWFGTDREIVGLSEDFFLDLKARFKREFGYEAFLMGHIMETSLYAAIDETHLAFGPSTHFWKGGRDDEGRQVLELTPGFWTASAREHAFAPRSGGADYASAWQRALSLKGQVSRLGITSWNFFPEGSQLADSETKPNPGARHPHPEELWGPSPRHYIELTSAYAAQWNGRPGNDSQFLSLDVSTRMVAGSSTTVSITFRNSGDNRWKNAGGYRLGLVAPENPFVEAPEVLIDDSLPPVPVFDGVFRGRPLTFTFRLTPKAAGVYKLRWRMMQQPAGPFGVPTPEVAVTVLPPAPGGLSPDGGAFPGSTASVKLSWKPVPGAASYSLRVQDLTQPALKDPRNNCPGDPHTLCLNGLRSQETALPVHPGHRYHWWVHADTSDGLRGEATGAGFSVLAGTPAVSIEVPAEPAHIPGSEGVPAVVLLPPGAEGGVELEIRPEGAGDPSETELRRRDAERRGLRRAGAGAEILARIPGSGTALLRFPKPATAVLAYDSSTSPQGLGSLLGLFAWDRDRRAWQALPGARVDAGARTITGELDRPAFVAAFWTAPAGEALAFSEVFAYPNPATGASATLHAEVGEVDRLEISLYDLDGRLVHQAQLSGPPGVGINGRAAYEYRWDVTGMASGTYLYLLSAVKGGESARTLKKLAVVR